MYGTFTDQLGWLTGGQWGGSPISRVWVLFLLNEGVSRLGGKHQCSGDP